MRDLLDPGGDGVQGFGHPVLGRGGGRRGRRRRRAGRLASVQPRLVQFVRQDQGRHQKQPQIAHIADVLGHLAHLIVELLGQDADPLFLTVGAAAPLQEAAVTGLRFGDEYYDDLREKYTAKRDLFIKGLNDIGIKHTVPQGAYYVMLDISEFGFESDLEFCDVLARDVGVGAVPGSSFFREPVNNLIRLHFAKKDETLYEAPNRLSDIRKKIAKR